MFRTLAAVWLVVVILLPFTAPFSTCDLPQVLVGSGHQTPPSAATALTRAATSAALPAARTARIRLLPVSTVRAHATIEAPGGAGVRRPRLAVSCPAIQPSQCTILRI